MKNFSSDKLKVQIYDNRTLMGQAAAEDIKRCFLNLLSTKEEIFVVFAAAPSQNDVLKALVEDNDIDWTRINAYHMDEYIGLPSGAPQAFGNFLKEHIFSLVPFRSVSYINANAQDYEEEANRYASMLQTNKPDVIVLGIGENGHIAFNDPDVADFNDEKTVKIVKLDEICRQQQVNDGCFAKIDEVPTHALTLTIPTLVSAEHLFCVVPCQTKAKAVRETVYGEINEKCPSTILRKHGDVVLYLDKDSASLL